MSCENKGRNQLHSCKTETFLYPLSAVERVFKIRECDSCMRNRMVWFIVSIRETHGLSGPLTLEGDILYVEIFLHIFSKCLQWIKENKPYLMIIKFGLFSFILCQHFVPFGLTFITTSLLYHNKKKMLFIWCERIWFRSNRASLVYQSACGGLVPRWHVAAMLNSLNKRESELKHGPTEMLLSTQATGNEITTLF